MNNELMHYGKMGMRWGIRRESRSNSSSEHKKVSSDQLNKVKTATDHSSKLTEAGLNIHKSVSDIKSAKRREDLSQLTDAELQSKIKRMNLEQQYATLNGNQVTKGQSYAKSTLEIAGSVLAIGSSAIGIAVAIKQLKGG